MNLVEWAEYLKGLKGHDLLIVAKTLEGILDLFSPAPAKLSALRTLVDAFFEEAESKETEEEAHRREAARNYQLPLCFRCKHFREEFHESVDGTQRRYSDHCCGKHWAVMTVKCKDFELWEESP